MIIRDAVKSTNGAPIYLTRTSPAVIPFLQSELVKHFTNGQFPETLHSQITYCLAQLLSTLLKLDPSQLGTFHQVLFNWTTNPSAPIREGALVIFSELVVANPDLFKPNPAAFIPVIQTGLVDAESVRCRKAALDLLNPVLKLVGKKKSLVEQFCPLAETIQQVYNRFIQSVFSALHSLALHGTSLPKHV